MFERARSFSGAPKAEDATTAAAGDTIVINNVLKLPTHIAVTASSDRAIAQSYSVLLESNAAVAEAGGVRL